MTTAEPDQTPQAALVSARDRVVSIAILAAVVVIAWWFLFGRGGGDAGEPSRRTAESYDQEYGGGGGRYEAILQWTDCSDLARALADGKANWDNGVAPRDQWRGQMAVTDDRMDALGCP